MDIQGIKLEKIIELISTPRTPAEALFLSDAAVLVMASKARFIIGRAANSYNANRLTADIHSQISLFEKVKQAFETWDKMPLHWEHIPQIKKNLDSMRVQILALQLHL